MTAGYLGPRSWELLMRTGASIAGKRPPQPAPADVEPDPAAPRQRTPAPLRARQRAPAL